jgi:hypothetical protein
MHPPTHLPEPGSERTPSYQDSGIESLAQHVSSSQCVYVYLNFFILYLTNINLLGPFVRNMEHMQIPQQSFITPSQAMVNEGQSITSTITQGELAQKLLAM